MCTPKAGRLFITSESMVGVRAAAAMFQVSSHARNLTMHAHYRETIDNILLGQTLN